MSVNIQAPSLKPPRVSLLSSADVVTIPGDKWWGGIEYKKLTANPEQGVDSPFASDEDSFLLPICPVDTTAKSTFPRTVTDRVTPFAVYATDDCSAFGSTAEEILDRARQKLVSSESWTIEHELWFGTGTDNFWFGDSPVEIEAATLHPLSGFALMDAEIAHNRADGRGMIHLTPRTFDLLQQYNLFRREGNVWFSPNDNIVVPGRGYGAGFDDEDDEIIYGHPGIIQIFHSDVFTFPKDADDLGSMMNRQTNDLWAVAERTVAYIVPSSLGTDGDTSVYKVTVDLSQALAAGGAGGGGDASAANQTAGNAILTDIETAVDGLETLLTAQDGRLANLEDSLTADAATLSNVADQDTNIQLLASNANRRGVIIHNDSPGILYVKYGTTASTTSYTYKIAADGTWDMPMPIYTGQIDGIWTSSASGSARITELT
jgi:hypothetical protein